MTGPGTGKAGWIAVGEAVQESLVYDESSPHLTAFSEEHALQSAKDLGEGSGHAFDLCSGR